MKKVLKIIFSEWFILVNFFRDVTKLPHLKWISSSRFDWVPNRWGNSLFNASSRSHVASPTPCLLHCTLQIRTSEFLVLFVTVSRILTGTSWYRRSFLQVDCFHWYYFLFRYPQTLSELRHMKYRMYIWHLLGQLNTVGYRSNSFNYSIRSNIPRG